MSKAPLYRQEYVGHMYNDWEIISTEIKYPTLKHDPYFLCKCHCKYCAQEDHIPEERLIRYYNLRSGATHSCGRATFSETFKKYNNSKSIKHNKYDLSGEYGIGFFESVMYGTKEFYFDKEDYELIKPYLWRIDNRGYVVTNRTDNKSSISMHRLVMNIKDKKAQVDHINHIKFDNRRCNLRTCSSYENSLNREYSNYLNGHGIEHQGNRYIVRFQRNGIRYYGGSFTSYQDALNKRIEMEPNADSEFQYEVSKVC